MVNILNLLLYKESILLAFIISWNTFIDVDLICCYSFPMNILSKLVLKLSLNFSLSRDAVGSYAENQRITAVRKVYQRGVVNPMINIELLWKDYNQYETVSISL